MVEAEVGEQTMAGEPAEAEAGAAAAASGKSRIRRRDRPTKNPVFSRKRNPDAAANSCNVSFCCNGRLRRRETTSTDTLAFSNAAATAGIARTYTAA